MTMFKERKYKHGNIKVCSDCHEPHGVSSLAMLKGDGITVCIECHEDHETFSHPLGADVLDIRTGQGITCVTCHNPMGTDHEYHLVEDGKKGLCVLCHKTY